jgi:hypothetical protein
MSFSQSLDDTHIWVSEWVSEWLLFSANSTIFAAISWREEVNFQWDDAEISFSLDQHDELNLYSVSWLKQLFADRHVAPLFWFRVKQSLLILLDAACLAEKQQIPIA